MAVARKFHCKFQIQNSKKVMNIRTNLWKMLPLVATLGVFSCSKESDNPANPGYVRTNKTDIQTLVVPAQFSYNTTREFRFRLSGITPDGTPVSVNDQSGSIKLVAPVQILDANPRVRGAKPNVLAEGNLDENGIFEGSVMVPSTVEKLYISPNFPGLIDLVEVSDFSGTYSKNLWATEDFIGGVGYVEDPNYRSLRSGTSNNTVWTYMGSFNGSGRPNYLMSPNDAISSSLLLNINNTIPEGQRVPIHSPNLIANSTTDIKLIQNATATVTFVHEGAGFRNALGYYYYSTATPPAARTNIAKHYIIFPNASYSPDGSMTSGMKVQLKYYGAGSQTASAVNTFPAGTTIGWFLVANGWDNSNKVVNQGVNGNWQFYGNPAFNPEPDATLKRHMVILKDVIPGRYVLGFEDIRRDDGSCDQDFNDCIFYATVTPASAVDNGDIPPIDEFTDGDGDGVDDDDDDYPTDGTRAHNNYGTPGTLLYEDLWPAVGDYDFNDLVVGYRYNIVTDAANKVKDVIGTYKVKAIGASFKNGFGISFNVPASAVQSVTGGRFTENKVTRSANGTESGNPTRATVFVTDNCKNLANNAGGTQFMNTMKSEAPVSFDSMNVRVTFTTSQTASALGSAPFRPFIFADGTRGKEIQLADVAPTSLMTTALFGTLQDNSRPAQNRYFKTSRNLPWGLHIPAEIPWAIEKTQFTQAYLKFGNWAESGGTVDADWYMNKPGYRDNSKIY